ncbi:MAG TPA: response regulator transcription factor [Terriglobia bacterium]|nr:response regulator transcription factor [Terriglobia bacterium]
MVRTKVLLADDHTLLLEAFRRLLEPEFEVVGTVPDGRALLAAARTLKPDVIIVDVAMPLLNGLDAARQLLGTSPHPKLIFLTMNPDPEMAAEALRVGASGYLLKTSAASELTKAIRNALRGVKYVTPAMKRQLEELFVEDPNGHEGPRVLSSRQREVLQLLVEGRPMKEVGDILKIAPRTVAYHKYKIMADLRVKTTAELIQYALSNKIVPSQSA